MALSNTLSEWRNRLLARHDVRRRLQRFPLTRPTARRRAAALFAANAGFIQSQVLAACLELDLLERLGDRPRAAGELANDLGLDPVRLERLLEAAATLELLEPRPRGRWGLGAQGAVLRSDPGLLAMSLHHRALYDDLRDPVALLRTDPPPTRLAALWPYAGTEQPGSLTAGDTERYTGLMAASQRMIAEQVLGAYDFSQHQALVDVGGGAGAFVAAVGDACPDLALTLMDLPAVLPHAARALEKAGLGERVRRVGGDFHQEAPPSGHDIVTLVRIVHDHDDGPAQRLLRRIHDALPAGGTLLVAEPMLGRHDPDGLLGNYFRFYLMAMGSGRPRSVRELRRMLGEAGFGRVRRHRTDLPLICGVLSARKAT